MSRQGLLTLVGEAAEHPGLSPGALCSHARESSAFELDQL